MADQCRSVFLKKTKDYGTAWRILRPASLTDQMFIKAARIRSIEESGENRVGESIEDAYMALVNYGIMALIQLSEKDLQSLELSPETVEMLYDKYMGQTRRLMMDKNQDYGEAWRDMRLSSLTDLILMKLLRIKQIEDNRGKTLASEGVFGNYQDIINYALFALIKLSEKNKAK
ncbi:MAG: DUF1599 domain-containing protein [Bacteroidetes bacterium]|nr:MAG: DUF1599 domain-containing protein [Bacteroidota bacterium]